MAFAFQIKHTCFTYGLDSRCCLPLSLVWVVIVVPIVGCKSFFSPSPIDKDESNDEEDPESNTLYMLVYVSPNNELLEHGGLSLLIMLNIEYKQLQVVTSNTILSNLKTIFNQKKELIIACKI